MIAVVPSLIAVAPEKTKIRVNIPIKLNIQLYRKHCQLFMFEQNMQLIFVLQLLLTTTLHVCVHLPSHTITMCCRHNLVRLVNAYARVMRGIIHSLRRNHVCFQDAARADSRRVVENGLHSARFKLVIRFKASSVSHRFPGKNVRSYY